MSRAANPEAAAAAVVALCAASGVVAGILAARLRLARRLANVPAESGARAALLVSARTEGGLLATCAPIVAVLVGVAIARIALDVEVGAAWTFVAMLVAGTAGVACAVPVGVEAEQAFQGPAWSPRVAARVRIWAVLAANQLPGVVGALAAQTVLTLAPDARHGALLVADAYLLGALAGLLVLGRLFARLGRAEAFPADLAAEAVRVAGADRAPRFVLWRTEGDGAWLAFAVTSFRGGSVLVSEDLLRLLPREQTVAVLVHEIAHLRLRHLWSRKAVLLTALIGVPLACAAAGVADPLVMFAGTWLVQWLGGRRRYPRQELEADAWAAARVPPEDLGRALVTMERAKGIPSDRKLAITHPALRERLVAMKLDADALLAA